MGKPAVVGAAGLTVDAADGCVRAGAPCPRARSSLSTERAARSSWVSLA
ncbi:hypothetical protein AB0L71_11120 [Streptomyces sp. NPDC052052]